MSRMFTGSSIVLALTIRSACTPPAAAVSIVEQSGRIIITVDPKLHSLSAARDAARESIIASTAGSSSGLSPQQQVIVELLPGVHNVGTKPLVLGSADAGPSADMPVVWRSSDPANPAVVAAPIHIQEWKQHATIKNALVASLPSNLTATGIALRHFWVSGRRASRPTVFACGPQQYSHNGSRSCNDWVSSPTHNFNFSLVSNTSMFPMGSEYDVSAGGVGTPSTWKNPEDVEFVFTSCAAFNCWTEPRCTVGSVDGSKVSLKQTSNSSCYHRLYYYGQGWGGKPEGAPPKNPTSIENLFDPTNFSAPGTFYHDKADGTILYVPRTGETAATLDATAITTITEQLVIANHTQNLRWENVQFQYATSLHTSGERGFVDTQSGYLYHDGEPLTNIHVQTSHNISFLGCEFSHLGAVYALGADQGSQGVIISNCTFVDCSGGGIKLGSSGERGAPAPNVTLDPALQDRGFLVADCLMKDIPVEYGSANPIFGAYVADTVLSHNTIINSAYSAICLGWGWGMSSYMRNVHAFNNWIKHPMIRLQDGGGLYTNTPCPNCNVSNNLFEDDDVKYGCLYHDGGSGQWYDRNNVFNHVHTPVVFGHGSCPSIVATDTYMNDSTFPHLQGATNNILRDGNGVCTDPVFVAPPKGQFWQEWPAPAAAIVASAGRRTGKLPPPVAPALSPPITKQQQAGTPKCVRFGANSCVVGKPSQSWFLESGVKPGSPTTVRSAVHYNATAYSCWHAQFNYVKSKGSCALHNTGVACEPQGCQLPSAPGSSNGTDCGNSGAWVFHSNGTISNGLQGPAGPICLSKGDMHGQGTGITVMKCTGAPNQLWQTSANADGSISISQNSTCVENNYRPNGGSRY